jgi:putative colanic acid biosynthesis acetyltransferase WcaF
MSEINHYETAVFSLGNKLKRLVWQMVWLLFCKWTPNPFYGWRRFVVILFGGKIKKKVHIYSSCKIWAPWLLTMDYSSCIGPGVEVYNPAGCRIGSFSIISQDAFLCGATHDYNDKNFTYIKKEIIIESYVWICAKSIVLPNVVCAEGAVLGAGSVTSKNLAPWSVYAGNPAQFIKERNNFISA